MNKWKLPTLFILGLFFVSFVCAGLGYTSSNLPKIDYTPQTKINYSLVNTNSSDYWDNMNTINSTQLENNGGTLSIIMSWLNSLYAPITEPLWSGNRTNVAFTNINETFDENLIIAKNLTVDTNTLFVNSNSNYVGIGLVNPSQELHVSGDVLTTGNYYVGATTNFIGYSSGKTTFGTSSAAKMVIDSSGNVGIGTTSPDNKLHVYGASSGVVEIEGNTDNAFLYLNSNTDGLGGEESGIIFQDNSNNKWEVYKDTSDDFSIYDYTRGGVVFKVIDNGNMLLMQNGGNVGIGTTSPDEHLHIKGNSSRFLITDGSSNNAVYLGDNHGAGGFVNIYDDSGNLKTRLAGDSGVNYINNGGNVGIGTTTPDWKLHVVKDSGAGIVHSNSTDAAKFATQIVGSAGEMYLYDSSGNTDVKLDADGLSYFNGGNVGIGTAIPNSKLEVYGGNTLFQLPLYSATGSHGVGIGVPSTGTRGFSLLNSSNYNLFNFEAVVLANGSLDYAFLGTTYSNPTMVFKSGNVGIGTTTPIQKLDVNGHAIINGTNITRPNANSILIGGGTAGRLISTGDYNTILGFNAGEDLTTGSGNIFVGYKAGAVTEDGEDNIAIGKNAYTYNGEDKDDNILIGTSSGEYLDGGQNVCIGTESCKAKGSFQGNVFIGSNSGSANNYGSGDNNVFIGYVSGTMLEKGIRNVGVGYDSGYHIEDGRGNVVVGGAYTGYGIIDGDRNIMLGETAGLSATGDDNLMFGDNAGRTGINVHKNIMIGTNAGYNSVGNNSIFIGYEAGKNELTNEKLYIENSNSTIPLIYGDFANDTLTINSKLGIAVPNPTYPLEVYGNTSGISIWAETNISATGYVTRTSVFDTSKNARDYVQNAGFYLDKDEKINHSKFYGFTEYTINKIDYSKPVQVPIVVQDCVEVITDEEANRGYMDCKNKTIYKTTYPYTIEVTEQGVNLEEEINALRQVVAEMKDELCLMGRTAWC